MMDKIRYSTICKIRQCSQCHESTEFYCNTCNLSLCSHCKEKHAISLNTINHDVVIFSQKIGHISKQETCVRHSDKILERFCQLCKVSFCSDCEGHDDHETLDLETLYVSKLQQTRLRTRYIQSDFIYYNLFLMAGIRSDVKQCYRKISHIHQKMVTKAEVLGDRIESEVAKMKQRLKTSMRHRLQQQRLSLIRNIVNIEVFAHTLEQTVHTPIAFLSFLKNTQTPIMKATPQLTPTLEEVLTEESKRDIVVELLRETHIIAREKRHPKKNCLKIMFPHIIQKNVTVTDVNSVLHITSLTSGQVWVNDAKNVILTDSTGEKIHQFTNRSGMNEGIHTVTRAGNLIYIDGNGNIKKLLADRTNSVPIRMKKNRAAWTPRCVFSSPSTGDLLTGMSKYSSSRNQSKIVRHNRKGKYVHTIQNDRNRQKICGNPSYITENRNGDVLVSGCFVTALDMEGRHRFSYAGPPSAPRINASGICTDTFSNILVCCRNTNTVQMIDKNGQFLRFLNVLNYPTGENAIAPVSLSYDDRTHLLWVGFSDSSTMSLLRYIHRRDCLADDLDISDSNEEITDTNEPQQPRLEGTA